MSAVDGSEPQAVEGGGGGRSMWQAKGKGELHAKLTAAVLFARQDNHAGPC